MEKKVLGVGSSGVGARMLKISGAKPSLRNFQLLTSTGVPSLDAVLGGGVAVGTVLLVEEDAFANYSHVLCRYFLAEGVVWQHCLYVASLNRTPQSILQSIPRAVSDPDEREAATSVDSLKIAHRYRHLPTGSGSQQQSAGGHFDLSRVAETQLVAATGPTTFGLEHVTDANDHQRCSAYTYDSLLESVTRAVSGSAHSTAAPPAANRGDAPAGTTVAGAQRVLRVLLHSMGAPLWQSEQEADTSALCRFLYALRALLRHSLAVAMVTVPAHFLRNGAVAVRLESLCDAVVSLESFEGSTKKTNPIFKDYQGLLRVVKLPCLNTLSAHRPLSRDFGFKLRRKKFTIETLHLPPELSESAGRGREEFEGKGGGCGSGGRRTNLDF